MIENLLNIKHNMVMELSDPTPFSMIYKGYVLG